MPPTHPDPAAAPALDPEPADGPGGDAAPGAPPAAPRAGGPLRFVCPDCGAAMAYDPRRSALDCAACGHLRPLPEPKPDARAEALRERDYEQALRELAAREPQRRERVVDCPACGAQSAFAGHVVGDRCAFCSTPLLLDQAHDEALLLPQALLPFALDRAAAQQVFARWVGSRWFAPGALKRTVRSAEGVQGVYMPWWTYDASTLTPYRGERGTRRRVDGGRPGEAPRVVTDWRGVSGVVSVVFDDVLVAGSPSIPAHLARVLDEWDLKRLRPPAPELLAGFSVEVYRHGLEAGFREARARMEPAILAAVRRDIGGDEQRIQGRQTVVDDIRYKLLLLPVWIGSYRHAGTAYRIVVNGQNGEVEGDRPYSVPKIALAVLLVLLVLAGLWGLERG